MITTKKNTKTNKISFWKNGVQVYPAIIKGNYAVFISGEIVKF